MINPAFLLSGVGMILAGMIPVMWWRYRTLVRWRNFWLGSGLWALAISLKLAMDLTLTPIFVGWLSGIYTAAGIALISGAYVGLRTGFFESGLTYVVGLRTRIRKFGFDEAVALGLGFGAGSRC